MRRRRGATHQQHIPTRAQQLRQLDAIPLSARQIGDALLLVARLEAEPRDVRARRDGGGAELDLVEAARDLLEDGVLVGEALARLLDRDEQQVSG